MFRFLFLLLFGLLITPWAQGATFNYIHVEVTAPTNALVTEGLLPKPPNAPPWNPTTEVILYGRLDLNAYRSFSGYEGYIPTDQVGDLLFGAAKDSTFASYIVMTSFGEGVLAASNVKNLVNSREWMSYDLLTDTFYYGTKAINFSRGSEFRLDFQYGGYFKYFGPEHFEIVSQSGVISDYTIRTVPEPAALGMILASMVLFALCGRKRYIGRDTSKG